MIMRFFGLPENVAEHGYIIDHMLSFVHVFMAVLFIGWVSFFFYILYRFRSSRNPKADYFGIQSYLFAHAELIVVLIEAVLLLGFALPLWAKRVQEFPDPQTSVIVHVVGEQYLWNYHYPGPDKKFGRRSLDLVSSTNPLGLDRTDPDAKDDILAKGEMHLPLKQPAILELTSKDVIHNFAMPQMRIAQDAIPGQSVPMTFKPIKAGSYEAICGQLCGAGHYAMRGSVVVDTPAEYEAWWKEQGKLSGAVFPAPAATTTSTTPVTAVATSPAPGAPVPVETPTASPAVPAAAPAKPAAK